MEIVQFVWLKLNNAGRNEEGVTAIEYAMIAALVAVALVTSLTALQTGIAGVFTSVTGAF